MSAISKVVLKRSEGRTCTVASVRSRQTAPGGGRHSGVAAAALCRLGEQLQQAQGGAQVQGARRQGGRSSAEGIAQGGSRRCAHQPQQVQSSQRKAVHSSRRLRTPSHLMSGVVRLEES